jgi:hypothetical protein
VKRSVSHGLAAITLLGVTGVGASRWRSGLPQVPPQQLTIRRTVLRPADSTRRNLTDAEDLIVSNDPFRLANEPAAIRYDPAREDGPISAAPVGPPRLRPNLVLKAVIGGPPWQAIVDGIPGQPAGTIVRAGSAFDQLVVRSVTRDSVVIKGIDTIWVLSFRRAQ